MNYRTYRDDTTNNFNLFCINRKNHAEKFDRNKERHAQVSHKVKPRNDVYGSAIVSRKWRSFEYRTVCGPSHAPTVLRARAHLRAWV